MSDECDAQIEFGELYEQYEDAEDWFWDALSNLHDEARRLVAEHLSRLAK